ncbi:transcriptional regulator [Streptomyces niveus]|uniref:transcriptional regulator n=1 Tax=Streptomyces niveus TaxID=193462 RepID=UPI003653F1CA
MTRLGLANRVNQASASHGRQTKYDHASVVRWLSGQRPRGIVPEVIGEVLAERLGRALSLDELGMGAAIHNATSTPLTLFIDRSTASWRTDEANHSTPMLTGLTAVGPIWEWEAPPGDSDVTRSGTVRLGPSDVATLRGARTHYEQMYRKAGGVAARGRVLSYLTREVAPMLKAGYSDAIGRELYRAAGALVAVAGICAYDSDAQSSAQAHFHQALRLAKASGDRAFGGYVIALLVNQSLFMREYQQAVAFAEAALRTAGRVVSPALATDLYAMQAKAYAGLGDAVHARRCMHQAETRAGQIRPDEEPAETTYVQQGLVEACVGEALTRLGDLSSAKEYAAEAARAPAHPRGRANRLASLAQVQALGGDPDGAARTAMQMLDVTSGMESGRLRGRLRILRSALTDRGRAASDAVEAIDHNLRVPW